MRPWEVNMESCSAFRSWTTRGHLGAIVAALALGVTAMGACSASATRVDFTGAGGGASTGSGKGGAGGNSAGSFVTSSGNGSGSGGACAATSSKGKLAPLDIYIMLDQSGSMSDPVPGGTKWTAITAALNTFLQAPASAGISVGIQ